VQFEDAKKMGTVEFEKIWQDTRAMFILKLEHPVEAESRFDTSDIQWDGEKAVGIQFPETSNIAKAFNHKGDVCISVPEEILDFVFQKENEIQEEIRQKKINQDFRFKLNDSDTYGIYNGISEFDIDALVSELKKQYPTFLYLFNDDIAKTLSSDPALKQMAFENYIAYPVNSSWKEEYKKAHLEAEKEKKADGYGIIPNAIIREKINKHLYDEYNKEAEKEKKEEARVNELLETAKRTGEKQIISKWTEPCNDPKEECSTDICHYWAMPNGTKKETRRHTW
jgi:hypothetical protein